MSGMSLMRCAPAANRPATTPAIRAVTKILRNMTSPARRQWQGKAKECRLSCAALWIVVGLAKPTPYTNTLPSRMAKAALNRLVTDAADAAGRVRVCGDIPGPHDA